MVQVINDPNRKTYGQTFSTALSTALQGLASHKIGQMQAKQQQARTAQGLEALLNIPSKEAHNLALLDPKILEHVVKDKLQGPREEEFARLALGGGSQPQQQQQSMQSQQQMSPEQELLQYAPAFFESEEGQKAFTPEQRQEIMQAMSQQQYNQQTQQQSAPRLKADQAYKIAELGIKKEKQQQDLSKDAREYIAPFSEKNEAAHRNIRDNDMLIDLAKSGELWGGTGRGLMSKIGLEDYGRNFTTEIGDKLRARLAQNAQSAFGKGTRVTNFLEKTYQRSIADLWNTPEGVIGIAELNNRADMANNELPYQERVNIIRENNGKVPWDIDSQVERRIEPKVKQLEKESMDIIKRMAEEGKNKKDKKFFKSESSIPEGAVVRKNGEEFVKKGGKLIPRSKGV